jgi:hypothetical protein
VRNDLFLRRGLDTPNQLEFAEQINFYVKSNSRLAGSMREAIAAADLSVIIGRAFARPVAHILRAVPSSCSASVEE